MTCDYATTARQARIARILVGDRGEIRDLLDDARQRAERLLAEL